MRVALLTDGIAPYVTGGMQRHSFYLCKYLVGQGVHVDLYHCDPNKKGALELASFSEEEKALITNEVIEFPAYGSLPGHYIRESYEYSRRIFNRMSRNAKPDFIYAKGFTAWEILNQKSKGKEFAPVGVNFHGYEMFQEQPGLLSWMKSKFLLQSPVLFNVKNADYLFSYGGKITDVIASLGVKRDRIVEIPGGINPDWITKEALPVHVPVRFLFVGRNERRKGIEELNAVIRKLNQESPGKFVFEFIGPIPPTKQVKGCTYHGEITGAESLKEIYRRCDVLVVPSHSEGMPNVILEGMASGLA
ncbi:MAG TPA: glycosyltransferase family 4 protein, partial [Bacteroidia bacterium]|nr:glycosyltransferase family 4 protein [Bacteroidia bacterium]